MTLSLRGEGTFLLRRLGSWGERTLLPPYTAFITESGEGHFTRGPPDLEVPPQSKYFA